MKKLLLLLLPLSVIFTSCEQKVDPVTYNDNLVKYSEDAEKRLEVLDGKIDAFFDSEEFSADQFTLLSESMKEVKDSIQSDLDKIKLLEKPSGAEAFANTTVAYVESLLNQVNTYNEQYAKLSNENTDEELMKMDEAINKTLEDTDVKLDEMIKAQTAFAKANNMELTLQVPTSSNTVQ